MEMHLVHKDTAGKLAVLAVFIEEGAEQAELERLWKRMPTEPGRTKPVQGETVNASKLLPKSLATYRYSGSLTTPPCSEDVAWFVLQAPIQASKSQITQFRKVIDGNNRPTQPLNGRTITASK
jgi:carbonic anhydrase